MNLISNNTQQASPALSIRRLLDHDVAAALKQLGHHPWQLSEYADTVIAQALKYDLTASLVVTHNGKTIAGNRCWDDNARQKILELKTCLDATFALWHRKEIEIKGNHIAGNKQAIAYALDLWARFAASMSNCEDFLRNVFMTSLVYCPLRKGSANAYDSCEIARLWQAVNYLCRSLSPERETPDP